MRYAQLATIVTFTAALLASACNRPQPTDETAREERQDTAAADRQRQQDETARLEQRAAELERDWDQKKTGTTGQARSTTAEWETEIRQELAEIRQALGNLRTTTPQNWWDRTEREFEQAANEVEQDVKRFARRWTEPRTDAEVGTTGTDTSWDARRDRFVARMRARIEAMENALRDVDNNRAREGEVDDTRARVHQLRDDVDRLDRADENDWWEVTRTRVEAWMDRLEARMNRQNPNTAG